MAPRARVDSERRKPPYAPVKGVREFFEKVRLKVAPVRIDRAYLVSIGVAAGNEQHLVATLKFLGLVDDAGEPSKHFSILSLKGPERQRELQKVLRVAYPGLFSGEFDVQAASRAQLHNFFVQRYGMQGQMARKATALFALLCEVSGVALTNAISKGNRPARPREAPAKPDPLKPSSRVDFRAKLAGWPIVISLTPEHTEDEIVALLRRIKRAVGVVGAEEDEQ